MMENQTSKRLEILKASLAKKEKAFSERLSKHWDDVRLGQGEPLHSNSKGKAIAKRWEKENEALRAAEASIEKTKEAIEREQRKIKLVAEQELPQAILDLVAEGTLTQWRKYPNRFFVKGVEKARIIWDEKREALLCSYTKSIPSPDQFETFRDIFNTLKKKLQAQGLNP